MGCATTVHVCATVGFRLQFGPHHKSSIDSHIRTFILLRNCSSTIDPGNRDSPMRLACCRKIGTTFNCITILRDSVQFISHDPANIVRNSIPTRPSRVRSARPHQVQGNYNKGPMAIVRTPSALCEFEFVTPAFPANLHLYPSNRPSCQGNRATARRPSGRHPAAAGST
jgi:hypothetical protein